MIMTAGREGEEAISKVNDKLDKSGVTNKAKQITEINTENHKIIKSYDNSNAKKNGNRIDDRKDMTKINAAQHTPKIGAEMYRNVIKTYGNQSFALSGFVSAMDLK